jgi:hypothetical protein
MPAERKSPAREDMPPAAAHLPAGRPIVAQKNKAVGAV